MRARLLMNRVHVDRGGTRELELSAGLERHARAVFFERDDGSAGGLARRGPPVVRDEIGEHGGDDAFVGDGPEVGGMNAAFLELRTDALRGAHGLVKHREEIVA